MKTKSSNSRKDSKKVRPMDHEKLKQLTGLRGRNSKDGKEQSYEKEETEEKGIGSPLGGKAKNGKLESEHDQNKGIYSEREETQEFDEVEEFEGVGEEWDKGSERSSGKKKRELA